MRGALGTAFHAALPGRLQFSWWDEPPWASVMAMFDLCVEPAPPPALTCMAPETVALSAHNRAGNAAKLKEPD